MVRKFKKEGRTQSLKMTEKKKKQKKELNEVAYATPL